MTGKHTDVLVMDPLYNDYDIYDNNLTDYLDDLLIDESYLNSELMYDLFKEALQELGPLEYDQCYAFSPILALGGGLDVKNLQKAKIFEYLSICSQV